MTKVLITIILFVLTMPNLMASNGDVEIVNEEIPGQGGVPKYYIYNLYRAQVISLVEETQVIKGEKRVVQHAEIEILNRDKKGEIINISNTLAGDPWYDMPLEENMRITIHYEAGNFYFIAYDKTNALLLMSVIFLLIVLLIGGLKGLKALTSLAITILLIIFVMVPLLLRGASPIWVSIFICAIATCITFFIIAGFNRKSLSATLGTTGGLVLGGIFAYLFGFFARLTGFSAKDANMLLMLPHEIDFDYRGLLFAGIIIGALGAAMDVAISIASSLNEIKKENPQISVKNLIASGFNIGRDIMGTMINTLALAYLGGTITVLILFVGFQMNLYHIVNLDFIASEIVRALAGSVGLVFAIPFTIFAFVLIPWEKISKRMSNYFSE